MAKRNVTLILEGPDGQIEKYSFHLGLRGAPGAARKIKQYLRAGFKLKGAEGDPQFSEWVRQEVQRYEDNPDRYKVRIRETVKLGTSIVKPKGKIDIKKVVKKVTTQGIKTKAQRIRDKFLRKREKLKAKNKEPAEPRVNDSPSQE